MTHVGAVAEPIPPWVANQPDDLFGAFDKWQRGRGFSPHTVRRRQVSLRSFVHHIDPLSLADATPELVEEWTATFRAPRTRHAYRSDLSAFYRWAVRRNLLPSNPVILTDPVRIPRSLPRPVPASLVPAIIASASDPDTRLMIALAAYAGLRRAEIAALRTSDVSFSPPIVTVRGGKGGKDRSVPLHPALRKMLSIRRVDGPLFHVSPDTVGRRVADHLALCGVDATCHQLRHTFGTELARVTQGNMPLVRQLMGHDDMNTTMGYIGWSGEGTAPVAAMYRDERP